jgi:hypothetical protein
VLRIIVESDSGEVAHDMVRTLRKRMPGVEVLRWICSPPAPASLRSDEIFSHSLTLVRSAGALSRFGPTALPRSAAPFHDNRQEEIDGDREEAPGRARQATDRGMELAHGPMGTGSGYYSRRYGRPCPAPGVRGPEDDHFPEAGRRVDRYPSLAEETR